MNEKLNVFNTLAHTLDEYELTEAISILVEEKRKRQGKQLLEMKHALSVGDMVEWFSGRSKKVKTGRVVKVKTKKAIVEETSMLQRWDIPMGMLKIIN
tara:strand:- start:215 stop:508 length:294 start_codon:yes stop_codon:yes gene_type:complete